ncbi:E3 SUMO-protein ligase MMS21 [Brassica rapa]|uniref:E3 SUMO-protein ligase MMS21 n=1 Tax=Brassica campestris TaxID=3711 RepID=UPI000BBEE86A|nr:E3 SUMO-protein ligase MMS21 [Brassica rapa]
MASASSSGGVAGRLRNASLVLVGDNDSTISDIRKAVTLMKNIAVQLEKDNQTEKVKDLENSVAELLDLYGDCAHRSSAIQSVANGYQPGEQLTDFKKLLDDEFTKLKATTPSVPENHHLMRQFREAVWNVHHAGEPMPGEDEEDIVMTSTQCPFLNVKCPVSGKPLTELTDPVRSIDCKHVYDKASIMHYIATNPNAKCPIAGCRGKLKNNKVVCDPMLKFEIEELRTMNKQSNRDEVIEDFTNADDED